MALKALRAAGADLNVQAPEIQSKHSAVLESTDKSTRQRGRTHQAGGTVLLGIVSFGALFAFWLLLSGQDGVFLLLSGAGSAAAVVWLARRMDVVDREGMPVDFLRAVLFYWPWLAWEILKSGWEVSKIILSPSLPISPTLVRFRPSQRSAVGLVTHANSITLTPGTITVEASAGEFLVHGLTKDGAEAAVASEMDRRIGRLEK